MFRLLKHFVLITTLAISCIVATPVFLQPRHAGHGRIFNGEAVEIADYPYQVSLQYKGAHNCGGSVISQTWVLTAAHCVIGRSAEDSSIRVGSSYSDEGGIIYNVSEIIMHEKYSSSQLDWDIAVLKISGPIALSDNVKIIEMADKEPSADTEAIATGWGITSTGSSPSHQLMMIKIPIVSADDCKNNYGSALTSNMLCAGSYTSTQNVCTGDSGGPLVANGVQVGVVSFGSGGDCGSAIPSVYDNVAQYRSWIKEKTGL